MQSFSWLSKVALISYKSRAQLPFSRNRWKIWKGILSFEIVGELSKLQQNFSVRWWFFWAEAYCALSGLWLLFTILSLIDMQKFNILLKKRKSTLLTATDLFCPQSHIPSVEKWKLRRLFSQAIKGLHLLKVSWNFRKRI